MLELEFLKFKESFLTRVRMKLAPWLWSVRWKRWSRRAWTAKAFQSLNLSTF